MEIDVMNYIVSEAYILIPVLYVIGMFLKRTPKNRRLADTLDIAGARHGGRVLPCRHVDPRCAAGYTCCWCDGICQPALQTDDKQIKNR